MKKIISVILAVVMAASCSSLLFSCTGGSGKSSSGALTTRDLTNVYKADSISTYGTIFESCEISSVVNLYNGRLLVVGQDTENYDEKYYITDVDFKNASELPIVKETGDNVSTYIYQLAVDKADGSIYYLKDVYKYVPYEGDDPIAYNTEFAIVEDGNFKDSISSKATEEYYGGDSSESYYLVKVDIDGNIVYENDISDDILKITDDDGSEYYGYIDSMCVTDGKIVFTLNGDYIAVVDAQSCELEKKVGFDNYINRIFKSSSGDIYASYYGDSGIEIKKFDISTGKLEDAQVNLSDSLYSYNFSEGELGYDFILSDSYGIYGYKLGDEKVTEICSFSNSDIDVSYSDSTPVFLEDGRILISYYDYNDRENVVLLLTKVDPSEVKEKYIITLAGRYIDYDVKSALMKFNRTSDEYKIIFKDYSKYDNESNDWNGSIEQLDKDIISNDKAPDIILIDSYSMDYDSYASKGVFADLYKFMDSDPDFDRSDYLENVFEAFETDGKLYSISPTVNFMTLYGKKSTLGDRKSWTMKDFIEMHQSLEDGQQMFAEAARDGMGEIFIALAKEEFIHDDGSCSFDSEEFKDILRYLKDLPADYSAYEDLWNENPNYWRDAEMSYINGTTILNTAYVYDFNQIPRYEALFGGEVNLIGYPMSVEGSSGALMLSTEELAINARSKVADGAWKAIKYLLSDEYQNKYSGERDENGNGGYTYSFPIKKSIIERRKTNDLLPTYYTYTDENGEEVREKNEPVFWVGDSEVKLRDSTEEDAERIYDILTGAKVCMRYDNSIKDIIMEEAAPYFDNQKTVDQVADSINSRIKLYVNERRG